mgnify:FL=1
MTNQQLDIFAITKTKVDSDVPLDLFSLEGYTWASENRNISGVGFYSRYSNINFLKNLGLYDSETLTIETHLS